MSAPMEDRIRRAIREALHKVASQNPGAMSTLPEAGTIEATHAVVQLLGLDLPMLDLPTDTDRLIEFLDQALLAANDLRDEIQRDQVKNILDCQALEAQNECDHCDWTGTDEELYTQLPEIPQLTQRLLPGEIVPSGTCPKCESLAYPVKKEKEA